MKSTFKDIIKIKFFLIFFQKLNFSFLNIFENNFAVAVFMVKREVPPEKDTIFYLYVT